MAGSQPGERRGGRQKGTPNRKSAERVQAAEASGLMPLDYMLSVLRDESKPNEDRMWAAEKAAPYVHAKLASVEVGGPGGGAITLERIERVIIDPKHRDAASVLPALTAKAL